MTVSIINLVNDDLHQAPAGHPESPARLTTALEFVNDSDIGQHLEWLKLEYDDIKLDPLFDVHDEKYILGLQEICQNNGIALDPDTYLSPGSFKAAILMARASIKAVDLILNNTTEAVHVAGRPPGHHAEYNRGMGFCLINNSAVAAQSAIKNHNLTRVAIIDWDVHHGNGTQNIFYERSDVFYISLHRYPFYPGTGAASETGIGLGEGYTMNFPLAAGTGNETYLTIFADKIIPALSLYKPELIIITCGFDAHKDDPLGGMELTDEAYGTMTQLLLEIANEHCDGRILSFFEGGYNPQANAGALYSHLKVLKGER